MGDGQEQYRSCFNFFQDQILTEIPEPGVDLPSDIFSFSSPKIFLRKYLNLFSFFWTRANFSEKSPTSAENMRNLKEGRKSHIENDALWKSHLNENICLCLHDLVISSSSCANL